MNNPASDLIALKKLCNELQRVIAYANSDKEEVARLADDVVFLGEQMRKWARNE
jgi:hypothetical protein